MVNISQHILSSVFIKAGIALHQKVKPCKLTKVSKVKFSVISYLPPSCKQHIKFSLQPSYPRLQHKRLRFYRRGRLSSESSSFTVFIKVQTTYLNKRVQSNKAFKKSTILSLYCIVILFQICKRMLVLKIFQTFPQFL